MSVLVSDRTESKFEAITYSIELHDMLIDLMQRSSERYGYTLPLWKYHSRRNP